MKNRIASLASLGLAMACSTDAPTTPAELELRERRRARSKGESPVDNCLNDPAEYALANSILSLS